MRMAASCTPAQPTNIQLLVQHGQLTASCLPPPHLILYAYAIRLAGPIHSRSQISEACSRWSSDSTQLVCGCGSGQVIVSNVIEGQAINSFILMMLTSLILKIKIFIYHSSRLIELIMNMSLISLERPYFKSYRLSKS